jgi:hypothetical protein
VAQAAAEAEGAADAGAALTRAQLLAARVGYACYLVYGALKNDVYAEFYGSRPSKLEFADGPLPNACRELVRLELAAALPPAARSKTPLFGPSVGKEWHHSLITRVFTFLLIHASGVEPAAAGAYSIHSFRIYLACALYAAGCPNDRIQAILRWKSEEALLIYARLNDSERNAWIAKARAATVDSNVAAHLPTIDGADMAAALMDVQVAAGTDDGDDDADEGRKPPWRRPMPHGAARCALNLPRRRPSCASAGMRRNRRCSATGRRQAGCIVCSFGPPPWRAVAWATPDYT